MAESPRSPQDASEDDAPRVRADLVRWYDEATGATTRRTRLGPVSLFTLMWQSCHFEFIKGVEGYSKGGQSECE